MNEEYIDKANTVFQMWKGAKARFHRYTGTHGQLTLGLYCDNEPEPCVVSFMFCEYICGPTQWNDCELECSSWKTPYGKMGYEVIDKKSGFIVRGTEEIAFPEK